MNKVTPLYINGLLFFLPCYVVYPALKSNGPNRTTNKNKATYRRIGYFLSVRLATASDAAATRPNKFK